MANKHSRRNVRTYRFEVLCKRELLAADIASSIGICGNDLDVIHDIDNAHDLPKEPQSLVDADRKLYAQLGASLLENGLPESAPPLTDAFKLHSRPTATKTLYIDFDGNTTSGTLWNQRYTFSNPFTSPAYDPANNGPAFNDSELLRIQRIWQRVSADFAPFDIDVTTEDPGVANLVNEGGADTRWGIRVVVTPVDFQNSGAGGFAWINSFNWNYHSPGATDTPAFVFNVSEVGVSGAVTHEAGHALGLDHDGTTASNPVSPNQEYYNGHGSGENGWGPIMGTGYYTNVTTWDQGEYIGARNVGPGGNFNSGASDLSVITTQNGFGYRPDDFGSSTALAATVDTTASSTPGSLNISKLGNIERTNDLDFFKIDVGTGIANLYFDPYVSEFYVNNGGGSYTRSTDSSFLDGINWNNNQGANLDIEAKLYDSAGTLIATSNPSGLRAKFENLNLTGGTYYISIDGAGFGNPMANPPTGYTDYGSLGHYMVTGTIVAPGLNFSTAAVDANKNEGNSGQTEFKFNVILSQAQATTATVNWTVEGNGMFPADAADFGGSFPSGTATFAPGVTSIPISIFVKGDTTLEKDETFKVGLSNPSVGQVLGGATGTIVNDEPPPILLVDDDQGENLQAYFQNALDANGLTYNNWNVAASGQVSETLLAQYDIVIWTTGDNYTSAGAGLSLAEQSVIISYLMGGGRLFLSGQDILYNGVTVPFANNYLHIDAFSNDVTTNTQTLSGVAGNPISDGMSLTMSAVSGLTLFPDAIRPANGGVGLFTYPSAVVGIAPYSAVSYKGDYSNGGFGVVFFAMPFEAISSNAADPNNQKVLMSRIIDFLAGAEPPEVAADQSSVGGLEGELLTNTGTWSDADSSAANVTLSASFGTVVKNANGTWSWSYQSTNELPITNVTITAEDESGGTATTTFEISVDNVAPHLAGDATSINGKVLDEFVKVGTWSDVAADSVTLTASIGTVVKNSDGTWRWSYKPSAIVNNQIVTITANDGADQDFFDFEFSAQAAVTKGNVYYKGSPYVQAGNISAAIETTKQLARAGATSQTLSYSNIINTTRGINGLIFEVPGLANTALNAAAFDIRMSPQGLFAEATNPPAAWALAPTPTAIIVTPGTSTTPATVRLEWADNAIANRWLRIQVLAGALTGLSAPETFYIGHLKGEIDGQIVANAYFVNNADFAKVPPLGGGIAPVTDVRDIDKNRFIANADLAEVRASINAGLKLRNITIPAAGLTPPAPQSQKLAATPPIQTPLDSLLRADAATSNPKTTESSSTKSAALASSKSANLALASAPASNHKGSQASASKRTNDKFFASYGDDEAWDESSLVS